MKHLLMSIIAGLVCFILISWKSDIGICPKLKQVNCQTLSASQLDTLAKENCLYILAPSAQQQDDGCSWLKYIVPVVVSIITGVIMKVMHFLLPRWYPDHFDSFN